MVQNRYGGVKIHADELVTETKLMSFLKPPKFYKSNFYTSNLAAALLTCFIPLARDRLRQYPFFQQYYY